MGDRLHVAKKYVVEYAGISAFNNRANFIEDLLYYLDIPYAGSFPDSFEIDKEYWKGGIETLKDFSSRDEIDNRLKKILDGFDCTLPELIATLEDFLKESDPDNDYLSLAFF